MAARSLARAAHRQENIGHHINECHVRSFSEEEEEEEEEEERITHFYDHPKEEEVSRV